jgi:hypothetical protein
VIIFGLITALTPLHLEAGSDVVLETLKYTLCAPILGAYGLAALFGGHRPSLLLMTASSVIILGSTAWMVFRCRSSRAYWSLTVAHILIVTSASIGFSQVTRYWNENPGG